MRQIDELLLKQCPPSEFSRPPRSIKKDMKYCKASELHSWLLFYSLPLDFLPSLYLHHFALFVCSLHILLQECISTSQIIAAEIMLQDFITMLPELYGEKKLYRKCPFAKSLNKVCQPLGAALDPFGIWF